MREEHECAIGMLVTVRDSKAATRLRDAGGGRRVHEDVATSLGFTRERVRQIEVRAPPVVLFADSVRAAVCA